MNFKRTLVMEDHVFLTNLAVEADVDTFPVNMLEERGWYEEGVGTGGALQRLQLPRGQLSSKIQNNYYKQMQRNIYIYIYICRCELKI